MDGPLRSQRPAARPVTRQPEPVYRQPKEPVAYASSEREAAAHVSPEVTRTDANQVKKPKKRLIFVVGGIILVVLLALGGWVGAQRLMGGAPGIDSSKYQVVTLANNMIYYGKLTTANSQYFELTDVWYINSQTGDGSTQTDTSTDSTTAAHPKLVKLEDGAIFGPEDNIMIPRSQVLFYTNLKPDGKVAQLISSHS